MKYTKAYLEDRAWDMIEPSSDMEKVKLIDWYLTTERNQFILNVEYSHTDVNNHISLRVAYVVLEELW